MGRLVQSWRKALAALALALVLAVFGQVGTAAPAMAECKPSAVPYSGNDLSSLIDPGVSVQGATSSSNYGQYGWRGFQWNTCEVVKAEGAASFFGGNKVIEAMGLDKYGDVVATIDTMAGNLFMGMAVFIAACMTALHRWNSNPTEAFKDVDGAISDLSNFVQQLVVNEWLPVSLILLTVALLWSSALKNVRKFMVSMGVGLGILAFISIVGGAPLTYAQKMDGIANSVSTNVDIKAVELMGSTVSSDEALGTLLQDKLIFPYWAKGETGQSSQPTPNKRGDDADWSNQMYQAGALSKTENKSAKDKQNEFNDRYQGVGKEKNHGGEAQKYIRGQGYNRAGMGFAALMQVGLVGAVRIPAEGLVFTSLAIWRFLPVLGLIFAVIGMIPSLRGVLIAGLKTLSAAAINIVIFGAIAAIHTAVLVKISGSDFGFSLIMSAILTFMFWKLSKPFRSLTSLASGAAMAQSASGMTDNGLSTAAKSLIFGAAANKAMNSKQKNAQGADATGDPEMKDDSSRRKDEYVEHYRDTRSDYKTIEPLQQSAPQYYAVPVPISATAPASAPQSSSGGSGQVETRELREKTTEREVIRPERGYEPPAPAVSGDSGRNEDGTLKTELSNARRAVQDNTAAHSSSQKSGASHDSAPHVAPSGADRIQVTTPPVDPQRYFHPGANDGSVREPQIFIPPATVNIENKVKTDVHTGSGS